jgi:hypothetical protein
MNDPLTPLYTVIHKEPIRDGVNRICGRPLKVDMQNGTACCWFMPMEDLAYEVRLFFTGEPIENDEGSYAWWTYLNTFQSHPFVWHAFIRRAFDERRG